MSSGQSSVAGLVALLVLGAGACATQGAATSGGEAGGAAQPASEAAAESNVIQVEVNHNRADGGIATIYIEPVAGVKLTLGTIAPGERKTFPYRVEAQNRTVRLSAINASGQTMTSSQITVPRGAGLLWDLQINSVRLKR